MSRQVYDNVDTRLKEMQDKQLDDTIRMAETLKKKLEPHTMVVSDVKVRSYSYDNDNDTADIALLVSPCPNANKIVLCLTQPCIIHIINLTRPHSPPLFPFLTYTLMI